jgi:cell division protein FtsW
VTTTAPRPLTRRDHPLASYLALVSSVIILTVLGMVMVLSASFVRSLEQNGSSLSIFGRQLLMLAIAVPIAGMVTRIPARGLRRFALPLLIFATFLQALVFVPGLKRSINGNTNWIGIGGFTVQPSELAKLALILFFAHVFATVDMRDLSVARVMALVGVGAGPIILQVLVGHDLGTALILAAIIGVMLFLAGIRKRVIATLAVPAAFFLVFLINLKGSRIARILAVFDPFSDANYLDAGWQPAHGIMAMATGGLFGVGLGASRQKWQNLGPEAHTDFIFAVIGEELGLLGSLVTLALFATLVWAAVRLAIRSKDPFTRLVAGGIAAWIAVQAVINIGSVIGLMPVIGVPLPLVSYGGSALGTTLVAMGVLIGIARREPGVREALAARASRTPA